MDKRKKIKTIRVPQITRKDKSTDHSAPSRVLERDQGTSPTVGSPRAANLPPRPTAAAPGDPKALQGPTVSNVASSSSTQLAMLFFIQGGAGDVLAATPMVRYWRHQFPTDKLVVLATYPMLWEGNANVDRVLPMSDPEDVFEQYRGHIRFFKKHFIYDHILDIPGTRSRNLPEFICKVYDAEYDGGPLDYFLKEREIKIAKTFLGQFKKPVILLHLIGAIPSEGGRQKVHNHKDLNYDDVKPVVEKYKAQFDFVQIGLVGEPVLPGAFDGLGMPMREAIAVVAGCKSFIFIESLFAHCANALRKVGVVVFNNTNPSFFGYPTNVNVGYGGGCDKWPCNRPMGALLDIQAGYLDPKTRARPLWTCENQLCARTPPQMIEEGLIEALRRIDAAAAAAKGPAQSLQEARVR